MIEFFIGPVAIVSVVVFAGLIILLIETFEWLAPLTIFLVWGYVICKFGLTVIYFLKQFLH